MESGAMAPLSGENAHDVFGGRLFINVIILRVTWHHPDPRPGSLEHRVDGASSQELAH